MSAQDDRKDELLKTPPASEQRTTPLGSSDRSATLDLPKGMDFTEARLAAVSVRYELEAELGRGGMGIVYRARDKETNERVALKVLKPEIASEQALLDRFKNELRLARKITHKNVCRTYELLRFGDTVVIAMEYVEGESLRAVLDRFRSMSLQKGIEVAQQVCWALREAHAQGIVHRDLKPENLMLDLAGHVKVMDFGIARSVETGSTTTGSVIGTPAYMAPEQVEGKPVDARTDIYSFGLILYEMFTGAAAFRADTPLALAMKQVRETPPAPREVEPTLPVHVERAIVKCLEKNPAKRFQSVGELEAALTPDALSSNVGQGSGARRSWTIRYTPKNRLRLVAAIQTIYLVPFILIFENLARAASTAMEEPSLFLAYGKNFAFAGAILGSIYLSLLGVTVWMWTGKRKSFELFDRWFPAFGTLNVLSGFQLYAFLAGWAGPTTGIVAVPALLILLYAPFYQRRLIRGAFQEEQRTSTGAN